MFDLNKLQKDEYGDYAIYGFCISKGKFKKIDVNKVLGLPYPDLGSYDIHRYSFDSSLIKPDGAIIPVIFEYETETDEQIALEMGGDFEMFKSYKLFQSPNFNIVPLHDKYIINIPFLTVEQKKREKNLLNKINSLVKLLNDFWATQEEIEGVVQYVNEVLSKED